MKVALTVNGSPFEVDVPPGEVLLDTLRGLGFRGVKDGCRVSDCGSCTVLVDGRPVASCSVLTGQVEGSSITTIEGIGDPASPHPLQTEFLRRSAAQCAYCMQGMIVSAKALLDSDPHPSEETIREGLSGNLCRCTGYVRAVEAVKAVADGAVSDSEPTSDCQERYATVGHSVAKTEGLGLLSGRARYTDDFPVAGMLHGRILRSPHAHARIKSIDASKALAITGVHCVLTHKDVPRVPFSTAGQNCPEPSPYDTVMLDDKVRFVGDRVAAVAAETPVIAEKAVALIEVEYEVLPSVLAPEQAMEQGAPVIHDESDSSGIEDAERNLAARIDVEVGDVEKGFSDAARVFEHEYRLQYVQGTPTEAHISMTYLDEKDRLVVVTSTQVPFHARRIVAHVNGLPVSRVRVVKPRIGGAFGAKQEVVLEDICAAMTLRTRRPVKLKLARDEELYASRTRHPQVIRLKTGVADDGRIVARQMDVLCNTGAYGAHALTVPSNTGSKSLPLYRADSLKYTCNSVYTNLPIAGALRGYGAPQGFFAVESQMDEIAHALGRDPVEYRLANAIREGDRDPIAEHLGEGKAGFERIIRTNGLAECWKRVREATDWDSWHASL